MLLAYRLLLQIRPTVVASWLKRLLGVKRRVIVAEHGRFWIDPASNFGLRLLSDGVYEPAMTAVVEELLSPGAVFVDLGANEGYFSVLGARRVSPNGRVVAIEPQRRLTAVIERNLELNGAEAVTIAPVAISDRSGDATLFLAPDTNTGATGLTRSTRYELATDTVPTRTLTELLEDLRIERVDLLKIDIEGFEYEAVVGAAELFRRHRVAAVALELHPWILTRRGLDQEAILSVFRDAGYQADTRYQTLVLRAPATTD